MELKIGAAYIRVSTTDQEEYSPDSQLKLIQDFAKREGYIIPEEYVYQDDGISGKSAKKRPAFQLMVATAKTTPPPFDAIFVWKYSRFARNQEESIVYKNLLKKNGVTLKSVSEPSSDSPYSSLIESIISWMDEFYLINLSEEVRRGMKEKSTRGEAMGKAPFGYRAENKMLVPDENAKYVQYIFELCASGKSFREISLEMENKGVKTPRGKVPDSYSIRYILRNPAYIGKTRWDENEHPIYRSAQYEPDVDALPDGKHEPIIPMDLWNQVQRRLSERSTDIPYIRRDQPIMYLLKGLCRCGTCGATLIRTTKRNRESYQCYKYSRGQCKVSHSLVMHKMDEMVISGIEKCVESGDFKFSPPTASRKPHLTQDWDKLIAAEENRLKRAKTAYLDGLFDESEYAEAKASAATAIASYKAQKEKESGDETPDSSLFRERVVQALTVVKDDSEDFEAKNKALRSIIDKVVYNKPENTVDIFFAY